MNFITLMIVLFIYLTFSSATGLSRKETLPEYTSLCPFSNFCETSSPAESKSSTRTVVRSCCQKCSCDPGCYRVGTCCPTIEYLLPKDTQSIIPRHSCVTRHQLLNSARNISLPYRSGIKFRVVDRCPDMNKSNQFPNCENPEILRDYVIVSDISNGNIFKNKHCAACHNVKDVIDWKLLITSCFELMMTSFVTVKDRNNYVLENCEFDARPPKSIDAEIAICYDETDVISKCNISKEWDIYDKALEDACLKERPAQNTKFKGNNIKMYSNAYCYLCNIEKREHPEATRQMCEYKTIDGGKEGVTTEFTAVLDLGEHNIDEKSSCPSMDVWDYFDHVCRPLQCPVGRMPVYGSCVNIAVSTTGYSFRFFLNLQSSQDNLKLLSDRFGILEQKISEMLYRGCGLCGIEVLQTNDTSALLLGVELYSTQHCSVGRIFKLVKTLVMKHAVSYRFRYIDNIFNISLTVAMGVQTGFERIDMFFKKSCWRSIQIRLHHLQNCPRFMFPRKELKDVGLSSCLNETTHDLAIVTDQASDVVSICVRKYFQLRQSLSKSHAVNRPPNIATFVAFVLFGMFPPN